MNHTSNQRRRIMAQLGALDEEHLLLERTIDHLRDEHPDLVVKDGAACPDETAAALYRDAVVRYDEITDDLIALDLELVRLKRGIRPADFQKMLDLVGPMAILDGGLGASWALAFAEAAD